MMTRKFAGTAALIAALYQHADWTVEIEFENQILVQDVPGETFSAFVQEPFRLDAISRY